MIWMETHPGEQDIVSKSRQHRNLVYKHWEDLTDTVQMQGLWGHLRQLKVLDAPMEIVGRVSSLYYTGSLNICFLEINNSLN